MGGTSKTDQTSQSSGTTAPWAPAQPGLQNILGQLTTGVQGAGMNGAESGAFDALSQQGQAGNPFASAMTSATNGMLAGGGANNQAPMVNDAYATLQRQLTPWANGSASDPSQNPQLRTMLDTINSDTQNSVNGMFAGAGRDLSGMNQQTLARGIAQGEAPAMLNAQQMGINAAGTLFGAGNTTGQTLAGMQQQGVNNQATGAAMAPAALAANQWGPQQILAAETGKQQFNAQNLSPYAQLMAAIGGMGSQTTGNSQTTGYNTASPMQQAMGWTGAFKNLFGGGQNAAV